jgi:RNA polymerase sigma-70 factor (ECF subfamily)
MALTLLQRVARGDAAAVDECLAEYGDTVWSIAERYLKPIGEDVPDAVQEIFVEVWRKASNFDPAKGGEAAFIATIAHHRLLDRCRAASSRARRESVVGLAAYERSLTGDPVAGNDELRAARSAFEELGPEEKSHLWMSLFHGLTHEQIAQATNTPLGTVKTRIRRGLTRLRETLTRSASGASVARGGVE